MVINRVRQELVQDPFLWTEYAGMVVVVVLIPFSAPIAAALFAGLFALDILYQLTNDAAERDRSAQFMRRPPQRT